jgi:hypothetical protein
MVTTPRAPQKKNFKRKSPEDLHDVKTCLGAWNCPGAPAPSRRKIFLSQKDKDFAKISLTSVFPKNTMVKFDPILDDPPLVQRFYFRTYLRHNPTLEVRTVHVGAPLKPVFERPLITDYFPRDLVKKLFPGSN